MVHRAHVNLLEREPTYLGPPMQRAVRLDPSLRTAQEIANPEIVVWALLGQGQKTLSNDAVEASPRRVGSILHGIGLHSGVAS